MKNIVLFFALFALTTTAHAQVNAQTWEGNKPENTVIWQGGKPGRTTDWNCPANWSNHRVPNEFTDVVIPDVSVTYFPVIESGAFEVNSLYIYSNANLEIADDGILTIWQPEMGLMQYDQLLLKGDLILPNVAPVALAAKD